MQRNQKNLISQKNNKAIVIGAGLAGSEAAWQLAERGIEVTLYEMRPEHNSPAHSTAKFAELVCSNSLRGADLSNAPGLLKEELRRLGSLIMMCADETVTPAGGALAVDREAFSQMVTDKILAHDRITVKYERVENIPTDENVIIATGPLTEGKIFEHINEIVGTSEHLHFYDAAAPIVTFESVDMESAYFKSRYDKGTPDYINCPMTEEEYNAFWNELCTAEEAEVHGFEDKKVFEGCMPVEVMGRRGHDTLLYGPMKPVGLADPKTGRDPYAVVQLRKDDRIGHLYNMVGFQTHLKFPEQKRVFSMIPALKNAEFVRMGVMHRNTFINSPKLLDSTFALVTQPNIRFAGQMTGVEGYIESCASGFYAGICLAHEILDKEIVDFPSSTALGALCQYVSDEHIEKFQPMNINFGIVDSLGYKVKEKRNKNIEISNKSLVIIEELAEKIIIKE